MFANLFGRHVRGSREDDGAKTSEEVWGRFAEHLESLLCFMDDIMNPQQIDQTSRTSVKGYWQTVKTKAEGMESYADLGEADLRKLGTYALWQEQSGAIDKLKQALSQFRSGAKDFGELAGSLTSGRYPPTQAYLDRMNEKAFAHCASGLEPVLFGLAPLLKSGLVPRSDVDRLLRFLVDEGAVKEFYSIFDMPPYDAHAEPIHAGYEVEDGPAQAWTQFFESLEYLGQFLQWRHTLLQPPVGDYLLPVTEHINRVDMYCAQAKQATEQAGEHLDRLRTFPQWHQQGEAMKLLGNTLEMCISMTVSFGRYTSRLSELMCRVPRLDDEALEALVKDALFNQAGDAAGNLVLASASAVRAVELLVRERLVAKDDLESIMRAIGWQGSADEWLALGAEKTHEEATANANSSPMPSRS